jgi:hypothetical protein
MSIVSWLRSRYRPTLNPTPRKYPTQALILSLTPKTLNIKNLNLTLTTLTLRKEWLLSEQGDRNSALSEPAEMAYATITGVRLASNIASILIMTSSTELLIDLQRREGKDLVQVQRVLGKIGSWQVIINFFLMPIIGGFLDSSGRKFVSVSAALILGMSRILLALRPSVNL